MTAIRWILFIPGGLLIAVIAGAILAAIQAFMDGTFARHGYGWEWGVGTFLGVSLGAFIAPSESKLKPAGILVSILLLLCVFAIWADATYEDGKRIIDYVVMAGGAICGWGQFLPTKKQSEDSHQ